MALDFAGQSKGVRLPDCVSATAKIQISFLLIPTIRKFREVPWSKTNRHRLGSARFTRPVPEWKALQYQWLEKVVS
jgi:hypothetical protein